MTSKVETGIQHVFNRVVRGDPVWYAHLDLLSCVEWRASPFAQVQAKDRAAARRSIREHFANEIQIVNLVGANEVHAIEALAGRLTDLEILDYVRHGHLAKDE